jgi:hypothetical protein
MQKITVSVVTMGVVFAIIGLQFVSICFVPSVLFLLSSGNGTGVLVADS